MEEKIRDFIIKSHKELLGYGLKWQMEIVVSESGEMYSNAFHPNYKTGYRLNDQFDSEEVVHYTFHRGFSPFDLAKWVYRDYVALKK